MFLLRQTFCCELTLAALQIVMPFPWQPLISMNIKIISIKIYNVLTGDGFINTFQLIAFLLSIFNIAALMVSNANNNNRNDNINDNQVPML
jgi:hypothetical protein